jgi:hypothetical protein
MSYANAPLDSFRAAQTRSTRHASDWGLASLLIGCTLLLLFPLGMLVLSAIYLPRGPINDFRDDEIRLAALITDIAAYSLFGLASLAVLFGLVGLVSGFARGQPVGLPTAGLVVGLISVVLWLMMLLAVAAIKRGIPQLRPTASAWHALSLRRAWSQRQALRTPFEDSGPATRAVLSEVDHG